MEWIRNGGKFKEYAMMFTPEAYADTETRKLCEQVATEKFLTVLDALGFSVHGDVHLEWLIEPDTLSTDEHGKRFWYCKATAMVVRGADDIVTRLREHWEDEKMLGNDLLAEALGRASDEIERLRADRDLWRHFASEYLYTDPECECPLCDQVRDAYNAKQ